MCYENEDGKNVMKVLETCNEELLGNAAATDGDDGTAALQKRRRQSSSNSKKAARLFRNDDVYEFAVHPHYRR